MTPERLAELWGRSERADSDRYRDDVAELVTEVKRLGKERDEWSSRYHDLYRVHRYDIRRDEPGVLKICEGSHHRSKECMFERWVPEKERDDLRKVLEEIAHKDWLCDYEYRELAKRALAPLNH